MAEIQPEQSLWTRRAIFIIAFFGIFVTTQTIHAANATCEFNSQLNELKRMRSSPENEEKKLFLRKNILKSILDCLDSQVNKLGSSVDMPVLSRDADEIRLGIARAIAEARTGLEERRAKVDVLSIDETKNMAQELVNWRKNDYLPLKERVSAFLLWMNADDVLSTASRRIVQIQILSRSLKVLGGDNVQAALERASLYFNRAQESNLRAKQSLLRMSAPDESLSYIKGVLESLGRMYQNLFAASKGD